ncbi:MAG: hypothetical protein IBX63_09915 [Coriobacteriia bacterium]|nr:hypothetical protein [Coriobacteriia bacterium]
MRGAHARCVRLAGVALLVALVASAGCASGGESLEVADAPAQEQSGTTATSAPGAQDAGEEKKTSRTDDVSLRVVVFDDTERSSNSNLEVWTKGLGSWYPNMEYGGDNTAIGPYARGSEVRVFVYPDGRDGTEMSFTLTITDEMISESDRDMVTLSLYDDRVEVVSTALPDIEVTHKR